MMLNEFVEYLAVFASSMFKFILGPLLSKGFGFTIWETWLLTAGGMMASVFVFSSFFGKKIHKWFISVFYKNRKLFTKRNRRIVKVWRTFGLIGVAFLTPILLTPIGGTLVATSFGEHRGRIFKYMLFSAIFWGFIISFAVVSLKVDNILTFLEKGN